MQSFIQSLALAAGSSLRKNFGHITKGKIKSYKGDILTKADLESEKIIINKIQKKYPQHNILAEESGEYNNNSDYTWIIDPLDGTRNFALGMPLFCVLIAKVYKQEIIESVVYDPIRNEMFYAKKNKGAYLNNKKIKVNKETDLSHMITGVGNVPHRTSRKKYSNWRKKISQHTTYWRNLGSAGLDFAYVACGRIDSFIIGGAYPWDYAASCFIIQQAGGVVTQVDGKKWQPLQDNQELIVSSSKKLHNKILKIIKT